MYRCFHQAVVAGLVASAHDASEGGLAVALAETAFSGGLGLKVDLRKLRVKGELSDVERLFSESNSRLVVTVAANNAVDFERIMNGAVWARIGEVTDSPRLVCLGADEHVVIEADIVELKAAWQAPLKDIR
jgi:phosphoribosylformylglycinamidine synthase